MYLFFIKILFCIHLKVEKRALCAFDNKRILLEDGIHTLAIGHHQVTASVEKDPVENPGGDAIMTASEARRVGLLWSKRKGATDRVERYLAQHPETAADQEIAAGQRMRARVRDRLAQIPDHPDRYDPVGARPPTRRHRSPSLPNPNGPNRKLKRVQIDLTSDEEMETEPRASTPSSISTICFQRGLARLDSQPEDPLEPIVNNPSQISNDPHLQSVGSSLARTTSVLSNDELPLTWPNLSRLGRAGGRNRRARRKLPNPFVLSEAEESEVEPDSTSENSLPRSTSHSHSDTDSESETDSDDSFVVSDDNFE